MLVAFHISPYESKVRPVITVDIYMMAARFQIKCDHEITLLKQCRYNIQAFILELLLTQVLVYVNDQAMLACIGYHLKGTTDQWANATYNNTICH